VTCFVVKRDLPGITPEALQSAGMRAKTSAALLTAGFKLSLSKGRRRD
jgi:hypothetical protein